MACTYRLCLPSLIVFFVCVSAWAQKAVPKETPAPRETGESTKQTKPPFMSKPSDQTASDGSVILVSPDSDEAEPKLVPLPGIVTDARITDFTAGLLVSTQEPNLVLRPQITDGKIMGSTASGFSGDFKIKGIVPFGESSAPLLYQGRQIGILHFAKPGLIAKPAVGDNFVAREGQRFKIVLENSSAASYGDVRARLRFENEDVCMVEPEREFKPRGQEAAKSTGAAPNQHPGGAISGFAAFVARIRQVFDTLRPWEPGPSPSGGSACADSAWTPFKVPQYAQITLSTEAPHSWFLDAETGYARKAKRKGWLTLRFGETASGIHEQNLPLEVQFDPNDKSVRSSLLRVVGWLFTGAALSLLLRVSIPNFKRKRQLKYQLNQAAKLTAGISAEVKSNLRVFLGVERRTLDQIRGEVWAFWPSYADSALRVEQGLPKLNRRIEAVQRLDAALIRRKILIEQGAAPTRLNQIEEMLEDTSDTLLRDQLSDEEWLFVKQRLESAEKLIREPSQAEKDAFEALLSGRWKILQEWFKVDANNNLKRPETPTLIASCFPNPLLLPNKTDDPDGGKWVKSVKPVRADLELSALELIQEMLFNTAVWSDAAVRPSWWDDLHHWLSAPTREHLQAAKSLLQQLVEHISKEDILIALHDGEADIVPDPALPSLYQKVGFSLRFRDERLNMAAARDLVSCRWIFHDWHERRWGRMMRRLHLRPVDRPPVKASPSGSWWVRLLWWISGGLAYQEPVRLPETGWHVYHFFDSGTIASEVSVDRGKIEHLTIYPDPTGRTQEKLGRFWLEMFQLIAALLVPLAALGYTTVGSGNDSSMWSLIAIGFGSDTIRNILVGREESSVPAAPK